MKYWLTQSLLSSWIYYRDAEDGQADAASAAFLSTLRREEKQPTKAMLEGRRFEALVNDMVAGQEFQPDKPAWEAAASQIAGLCMGGQPQVPVTGELTVGGMDFVLYGVCDYVKEGAILDIKKVTRYAYGKYYHSPQHPVYLHLLPAAERFDYLIFDGSNVYVEGYRREDCIPLPQIIGDFVGFLSEQGLLPLYREAWAMNARRETLVRQCREAG